MKLSVTKLWVKQLCIKKLCVPGEAFSLKLRELHIAGILGLAVGIGSMVIAIPGDAAGSSDSALPQPAGTAAPGGKQAGAGATQAAPRSTGKSGAPPAPSPTDNSHGATPSDRSQPENQAGGKVNGGNPPGAAGAPDGKALTNKAAFKAASAVAETPADRGKSREEKHHVDIEFPGDSPGGIAGLGHGTKWHLVGRPGNPGKVTSKDPKTNEITTFTMNVFDWDTKTHIGMATGDPKVVDIHNVLTADKVTIVDDGPNEKRKAILEGHVHIIHHPESRTDESEDDNLSEVFNHDVTLDCDHAEYFYRAKTAFAIGSIKMIGQDKEEGKPVPVDLTAERLEYDDRANSYQAIGNVVIHDGDRTITSPKMTATSIEENGKRKVQTVELTAPAKFSGYADTSDQSGGSTRPAVGSPTTTTPANSTAPGTTPTTPTTTPTSTSPEPTSPAPGIPAAGTPTPTTPTPTTPTPTTPEPTTPPSTAPASSPSGSTPADGNSKTSPPPASPANNPAGSAPAGNPPSPPALGEGTQTESGTPASSSTSDREQPVSGKQNAETPAAPGKV